MSRVRAAWDTAWLQPVLVVLVALLGGLFVSDFQKVTLALWVIYGLVALSLDLVWGRAGIFSFGQTAFFGVAAYSYGVIGINLSPNTGETVTALIGGVVVAALLAAALGYFMFYGKVEGPAALVLGAAEEGGPQDLPAVGRELRHEAVRESTQRALIGGGRDGELGRVRIAAHVHVPRAAGGPRFPRGANVPGQRLRAGDHRDP